VMPERLPVTVLAPLAVRYGVDRSGVPEVEIPSEPDGVVRAMPVVLRLERPQMLVFH